jgi:uncharacterized damage-inducible protein DinB
MGFLIFSATHPHPAHPLIMLTIPAEDLLRWNDETAIHWRDLVRAHPEILSIPCDVRASGTVARVLQHIVAVELRYAERLSSLPETSYDDIPYSTADELFVTHVRALDMIRTLLADDTYDWNQPLEFQTLSIGRLRATRRDILLHLLMHSIRHYAQLATLVRSQGTKPGWQMDFLVVNARPV